MNEIFILIPMFDVNVPPGSEIFFKGLYQISSQEMIPTEKVYGNMLLKLDDASPSNPQIEKF